MKENVKYFALNNKNMPPIFAYSSLVTDQIVKECQKAGFLECLSSPLKYEDVQRVVREYLDAFCMSYIDERFQMLLGVQYEKYRILQMLEISRHESPDQIFEAVSPSMEEANG